MLLTPHQAKYIAHDLTLQHAGGGLERLSQALFNASVDLTERKRQLLVICPASLRKQWALELQDKFNLPAVVLDAKSWREAQPLLPPYDLAQQHPPRLSTMRTRGVTFCGWQKHEGF